MTIYRIYRPGEGFLLGDFNNEEVAKAAAYALDTKVFNTQKKYERARDAGALHQVREVSNGQEAG